MVLRTDTMTGIRRGAGSIIRGAKLNKVFLLAATVGKTLRSSANGNNASNFDKVIPLLSNASSKPESAVKDNNFNSLILWIIL